MCESDSGHRGEHEGNRKTIARGMPGNPGVTVVTTLVCFLLCTRGCGRIRRPAFPAPSEFRERHISGKTRAKSRSEIAKPCRAVIVSRRHCELCRASLRGASRQSNPLFPLPLYLAPLA